MFNSFSKEKVIMVLWLRLRIESSYLHICIFLSRSLGYYLSDSLPMHNGISVDGIHFVATSDNPLASFCLNKYT